MMMIQPMKGHMPVQRPITLNMGMRMNGWFDLTSLDKIILYTSPSWLSFGPVCLQQADLQISAITASVV